MGVKRIFVRRILRSDGIPRGVHQQVWTEWQVVQVVQGREIINKFDLEHEARAYMTTLSAAAPAPPPASAPADTFDTIEVVHRAVCIHPSSEYYHMWSVAVDNVVRALFTEKDDAFAFMIALRAVQRVERESGDNGN